MTGTDDDQSLADRVAELIQDHRSQDAVDLLEGEADPLVAAEALARAVATLYGGRRDVRAMIRAATVGLAWCLERAETATSPDTGTALKGRAQSIGYNAAANCWPGWGDEGIVISDGDIAAGLELATLSRRLVQDLALSPARLGKAHWLVGALELAAGRPAAARALFEEAAEVCDPLSAEALMAHGYAALAEGALPHGGEAGAQNLGAALARLRALGTEQGDFFADQIETAQRVLAARGRAV